MPFVGNSFAREQSAAPPRVSLLDIFWTFLKVGTTSFGGASRAIMHNEAVERHHWLDEKDYLAGFALSQVLPGANPVNLALYIGLKVRGMLGATVAVCGMIVPAFCLTLCLGYLYRSYGHLAAVHFVLAGLAAAGVGATLTMAIKVARRLPRNLMTALIAMTVFLVVGLLRWPMVPVVLVAVPLSIALAFVQERKERKP